MPVAGRSLDVVGGMHRLSISPYGCFCEDLLLEADARWKRLADEAIAAVHMNAFENGSPEMRCPGPYVGSAPQHAEWKAHSLGFEPQE